MARPVMRLTSGFGHGTRWWLGDEKPAAPEKPYGQPLSDLVRLYFTLAEGEIYPGAIAEIRQAEERIRGLPFIATEDDDA
jgi:hypothetical protein